jgi:hypothetical protein
MATVARRSSPRSAASYARVREALRQEAGLDLSTAEVSHVVELAREQRALDELADAMARTFYVLPPATARAAQAGENAVKSIEGEFGLLTSVQVARLLGSSSNATAVRSLAKDMRARGELLYVRRLNKYLYPGFQFDRSLGRVRPFVKDLLRLADANGWEPEDVVLWLCSPTTYFEDESRPVDHIDTDPDQVLDVAARAWDVEW